MSIQAECPKCGRKYKLADERAGKKVRCKDCATVFAVPTAGKILKHKDRTTPFTPAFGSEDIEPLSDHIESVFGPIEMVYHEIVSDLVHIDVHWIKATSAKPYHVLATTGMSDLPMTVPPGAEEYQYCELVLALPADWTMNQEDWKDEDHYWPIRWLKLLARFPHEHQTWLCIGHSIPNGDPPERFAPSTALSGWVIGPAFFVDGGVPNCVLDDEKTVRFWSPVPVYTEEMNFKIAHGADELMGKFDAQKVSLEVIDPNRPNVCRKRWKLW